MQYIPTYASWENGAAVDPWIRMLNSSDLERFLEGIFTLGNNGFVWRGRMVPYHRDPGQEIRAEDEILSRWDESHPSEVFRSGFSPRRSPYCIRNPDQEQEALNLRTYVAENHASVYVSTTRRVRRNSNYVWTPRQIGTLMTSYLYHIYAPGGIDVVQTLGLTSRSDYANQNEIAFFGGIHREFIFGAMEFQYGKQFRYHYNPSFRPQQPRYLPLSRTCKVPYVYHPLNDPTPPPPSSSAGNFCPAECSTSGQRAKRSATVDYLMRGEEGDAPSCTKWFVVNVISITFKQYEEEDVEPYGYLTMYIYIANKVSFWHKDYRDEIPTISGGFLQYGEPEVLQGLNSNSPLICFEGVVHEWDPSFLNIDEPLTRTPKDFRCQGATPNIDPDDKLYSVKFTSPDGYVKISYSVKVCDETCINSMSST